MIAGRKHNVEARIGDSVAYRKWSAECGKVAVQRRIRDKNRFLVDDRKVMGLDVAAYTVIAAVKVVLPRCRIKMILLDRLVNQVVSDCNERDGTIGRTGR